VIEHRVSACDSVCNRSTAEMLSCCNAQGYKYGVGVCKSGGKAYCKQFSA